MLLPFDGARLSFNRGGHESRQQLLQLLSLLPLLFLHLLLVEWLSGPSWYSLCSWMLTLTHSVMSCVRWTPMLVVLHDNRLPWVVSLLILLHLHRLQRMRVMMAPAVMMLMRTIMLACPVMMRRLLDLFTLCHLWQNGGVVLIWE